ncbi:MAG: glucose-1-phosphate thymidylyltransferase, partial [Myxococcota bacterium]
FIEAVEQRQSLMVACLEEVAFRMGYIDRAALQKISEPLRKSPYGEYLLKLAAGEFE